MNTNKEIEIRNTDIYLLWENKGITDDSKNTSNHPEIKKKMN